MSPVRVRAVVPACAVAVAVVLSVLYLTNAVSLYLQVVSCWLAVAVAVSMMAYFCFRAARLRERTDPRRRFAMTFALSATCFSAGEWAQVATTVAAPYSTAALTGTGLVRTVALGLGGSILIFVVLTYPLPHRSARERRCYLLDLTTVIVAAGAYGLYWTMSAGWAGHGLIAGQVAAVAAGPVVAMLAAFAVGRLYLSGASPFHWHIGVLGPVAAAVEGIARALGPELARAGRPDPIFAMSVCSHVLLMVAAWLQYHRAQPGPAGRPAHRRRPYSLVPYAAVAGTYLLLVVTMLVNGLDLRTWVILAGAGASTGIVMARQLVAFADNAQLLTERDALSARLHTMAFTDSLTGLGNRALFLDRLAEEMRRAGRDGTEVGVLLIDLDDFKPVNDGYGHAAGDAVLVQVARRLRDSLRPADVVARLGGDEFAVLVGEPPSGGFDAVAGRIVEATAVPCQVPGAGQVRVRASVGVAVSLGADDDASALLKRADDAMYRAKCGGKGSFRLAPVP